MKEERKIKMTITKEQETTVEMTLMDYLLDMEDFIQGKKTLNVMNVRRPKAALVKILQADLDDFKQNGFEDGGEDFAENLTQTITVLENMTDAEYTKIKQNILDFEPGFLNWKYILNGQFKKMSRLSKCASCKTAHLKKSVQFGKVSLVKESASDKIRGLGSSPRLKKYRKNRA